MERRSRPPPTSPRGRAPKRPRNDTTAPPPHLPARPPPPSKLSRTPSYRDGDAEMSEPQSSHLGRYSVTKGPPAGTGVKIEPQSDRESEGTPGSEVGMRIMGTAPAPSYNSSPTFGSLRDNIRTVAFELPITKRTAILGLLGELNSVVSEVQDPRFTTRLGQVLSQLHRVTLDSRNMFHEVLTATAKERDSYTALQGAEAEIRRVVQDNKRLRFDESAELDQCRRDMLMYRRRLDTAEHEVEVSGREVERLKGEIGSLNKKLVTSEQAKSGLAQDFEKQKSEYHRQINDLKYSPSGSPVESSDLVKQVESMKAERDSFRTLYTEVVAEVKKTKMERDQINTEYSDLKDTAEKLEAERDQLRQQNRELKGEVDKIKAENDKLTRRCTELKNETEKVEAQRDQLGGQNEKKMDELVKRHDNLQKELDSLKVEKDHLDDRYKELSREAYSFETEKDMLKRKIDELESINRSLRDNSEAQTAQSERLEALVIQKDVLISEQHAQIQTLRSMSVERPQATVLQEVAAQFEARPPSPDIKWEPGMTQEAPEQMQETITTVVIPPLPSSLPVEQILRHYSRGNSLYLIRKHGLEDLYRAFREDPSSTIIMTFFAVKDYLPYEQQSRSAVGFWTMEDHWAAGPAARQSLGDTTRDTTTDKFVSLCLLVPLLRGGSSADLCQKIVKLLSSLSQLNLGECSKDCAAFLEAMASLPPPITACGASTQNLVLAIAVCEFCRHLQAAFPGLPQRGWTIKSILGEDMFDVAQALPLGKLDVLLLNPDRTNPARLWEGLQRTCGDQFCSFTWEPSDGVTREIGLLHCSMTSSCVVMIDFGNGSFRLVDRQLATMRQNVEAPKKWDLLLTRPSGEMLFEMLAAPKDARTFWSKYVLDDDDD